MVGPSIRQSVADDVELTTYGNRPCFLERDFFLGSGPDRGKSPVEWGEIPFVHPSIYPSIHSSAIHPRGLRTSCRGLRASWWGLRASWWGLRAYHRGLRASQKYEGLPEESEALLEGSEGRPGGSEGLP